MDSKLIQGMLLGSCLLLLFATLMTGYEATQYKGDLPAVSASAQPRPAPRAPAAQPEAPAEEPAATGEPAEPPAGDAPAEPAA